jgi:hypothetical protein
MNSYRWSIDDHKIKVRLDINNEIRDTNNSAWYLSPTGLLIIPRISSRFMDECEGMTHLYQP